MLPASENKGRAPLRVAANAVAKTEDRRPLPAVCRRIITQLSNSLRNNLRSFRNRSVAGHVAGVAVAVVRLVNEDRAVRSGVRDAEVDLVEAREEVTLVQLADGIADVVQFSVDG